jgi:hypothetical protein
MDVSRRFLALLLPRKNALECVLLRLGSLSQLADFIGVVLAIVPCDLTRHPISLFYSDKTMRGLRLKTIKRSHNPEKKWDAVFVKPNGQTITQPFGQRGYSDYTKHKNLTRKKRYIARHARMHEDWSDPTRAGTLSRYILWGKPTLKASIRSFKKKFHV